MNNIMIKKLIFFSSIISILNISGVIFACEAKAIVVVLSNGKALWQTDQMPSGVNVSITVNNDKQLAIEKEEDGEDVCYDLTERFYAIVQDKIIPTHRNYRVSTISDDKKTLSKPIVRDFSPVALNAFIQHPDAITVYLINQHNQLLVFDDLNPSSWRSYQLPIIGILAILLAAYYFIKIK